MHERRVLSRAALRALDRDAIERYGIPGIVLMENAAIGLTEHVRRAAEAARASRIVVFCGTGNNGGDGYAAARHLHNGGRAVVVVATGAPRAGTDAAVNESIVRRMAIPIVGVEAVEQADARTVAVDAILGTGLSKAPAGAALRAIEAVEQARADGATIVSADVPSGLDADTGRPPGACVQAHLTVTFAAIKRGFHVPGADRWTGRVELAGIGAPPELLEQAVREDAGR